MFKSLLFITTILALTLSPSILLLTKISAFEFMFWPVVERILPLTLKLSIFVVTILALLETESLLVTTTLALAELSWVMYKSGATDGLTDAEGEMEGLVEGDCDGL